MMDELFKISIFEEFTVTCDKVFKNLLDHVDHRKLNFIHSARKQILELLLSSYGNVDEISLSLLSSGYEICKVEYFVSLVENRKNELLYLTLLQQTCKQGETVVSFDWIIKLICGTSDLKTLKEPIMQLAFRNILNNGCSQNESLFELDKTMLTKFIEVLENLDQSI